jgi:PHD/YefM family antitoxin component YafN of YafNO toxin-antitoxin module
MKTISIQELQENFEFFIDLTEKGQQFLIKTEHGNVILMPCKEFQELDDLVRIHTNHEEGC